MHAFDPPFIRLSVIERIEHLAPNRAKDFLTAYKLASGEVSLLGREPATEKMWTEVRRHFINRHEQQAKKLNEAFWTKEGQPSPRHLAMMMWAYTPTPDKTAVWISTLGASNGNRLLPSAHRGVARPERPQPDLPPQRQARRRRSG